MMVKYRHACRNVIAGAIVRRPVWSERTYLAFHADSNVFYIAKFGVDMPIVVDLPTAADIMATDWQIVASKPESRR